MSSVSMDVRARVRHRSEDPGEPVGRHGRTKEGADEIVSPPLSEERHKKAIYTYPGGSMFMTFMALRTNREPALAPASDEPMLRTSISCITDGSRPVRSREALGACGQ